VRRYQLRNNREEIKFETSFAKVENDPHSSTRGRGAIVARSPYLLAVLCMISRVWTSASAASKGGKGPVTTSYCPGEPSAWYNWSSIPQACMPSAISSRTLNSGDPEGRAGEPHQTWLLAGWMGEVDLRRKNSISKPTRKETPEFDFASLEGSGG